MSTTVRGARRAGAAKAPAAPQRNSKVLSVRMANETSRELRELSDLTGLSVGELVARAVRSLGNDPDLAAIREAHAAWRARVSGAPARSGFVEPLPRE